MSKPKILILGAGYLGMMTASRLQKKLKANEAEVTLVNKHDYHYQATWLHENAAGTVSDEQTMIKISEVIDFNKINFVKDVVVEIKPEEKKVILEKGEMTYDYLVIGLGYESETFGIPGLQEHAFKITTINECVKIRQHMDAQFKKFTTTKNIDDLTIIVGGAGFTGVEFLAELPHTIEKLGKKYNVDPSLVKIICVEGMGNVLPGFDAKLVNFSGDLLGKMGVELMTNTFVKECTETSVVVETNGERKVVNAGTVVWAAGIRGNSVVEASTIESNRGRVVVDEYLRPAGYTDLFIAGDCALVMDPATNRPHPPTAQIAIQAALPLADNLVSLVRGKQELKKFEFHFKGTVCSMGYDNGVGVVFGAKVTGWRAAFMKKVIDNRWLFMIGGIPLVLKKGKFKFL